VVAVAGVQWEAMSGEHEPRRSAEPSLDDLRAAAAHADDRLALYRRRMYLGRGEPSRLAELERIAAGAAQRVRRALSPPG